MAKKQTQDKTSIGFEDKIWKAADVLRGNLNAAEYEGVVLGLIFLKYISDRFDEMYRQLKADEYADEEDKDEYTAENVFFVPKDARWQVISEAAHTPEVGVVIDNSMLAIERENQRLRGILPKNFARPELDKRRLGEVVELFSNIEMHDSGDEKDLLGRTYEYCLQKFASMEGKNAGEFYTPRPVVQLLIRILDPQPGESVYDPACGSGGMLIEAVHHMNHSSLCCGNIFGQEKNVVNSAIAKMNLFLHGASDFNIMQGDTLRSPKILQGSEVAKFDCVIANPPFSLEKWGSVEWSSDKYGRNIWGTPSDSCGDYAWIQHMVKSMAPGSGRMAVVMPQGVLFRGNEEGRIREKLVKSDMVEAVVTLGDKLFYGTGLSPCFLILRRMKPAVHSARILMIDGTKILTQKRAQNILEPKDVDHLYELYTNYKNVEDYSQVVTLDEVAAKGYDLSPNKYVQYHREAIKPYAEVLAEFKAAYEEVKQREAEFRKIMAI